MSKQALVVVFIVVAAAILRVPHLAERPMHADEAIYAFKLQTLLNTGGWNYDPGEYHGPVLHYLSAAPVRIFGLSENTLRGITVVLGLMLVLMPLSLVSGLGRVEALAASGLIAISPAMIYYSRYYIPEMLLTLLTAGLVTAVFRYSWGAAAGLLLGLMFATKETAIIAGASLLVARRKLSDWRGVLVALAVAIVVVVLLLGPKETVQALSAYAQRAGQRHLHPWYYYLLLLARSELVVVALAIVGAVVLKQRFLAVYTLSMAVVYSLIPYKTPWCLLGFLYGMILLAGVGLVYIARRKAVALVLVAVCAVPMFTANASAIYDYAGTSRDAYAVRERLEKYRNLPIQVITSQNIWPLPWYMRDFAQVEWRRTVTPEMRPAPVIIATPDVEPALVHQLYEVLPPGQRPLYVDLFGKYTELRPGLELRGYIQQSALTE